MTTYAEQAMQTAEAIRNGETISLAGPVRPPDPEALGRIRNIVKTAHKWGGDGVKPQFRKIRKVLLAKHPEVISKAFGGNADTAAGWIKANWYKMRGRGIPATRGKGVKAEREMLADELSFSYVEAPSEFWEGADELFLAANAEQKDGLVWTTALRTGEWQINPTGGKGPLMIDKAFLDEVLVAWNENAWEHVTVPTYHTDTDVLANTGFVRDLRVIQDPKRRGEWLLRAGIEFTEKDVEEKVLRGTIAGCSVNVKYNIPNQETGKTYKRVLTHIALTNIPFINKLESFKQRLAADKDATPDDVEFSYVHEEDGLAPDMSVLAEVSLANDIWDESQDYTYVREKVQAALAKGYYLDPEGDIVDSSGNDSNGDKVSSVDMTPAYISLTGMTPDKVLVMARSATGGEYADAAMAQMRDKNGMCQGWVFGYEVDADGMIHIDPVDEWSKVEKQWVELDREFQLLEPEGVEAVRPEEKETKAQQKLPGIRVRLTNDSPEGGATGMAEEKKDEAKAEEMTLTREDLDRIADERAEAKLQAFREEQEARDKEREDELTAMRRELHVKSVKEQVDEMVKAGHAPAVVEKAKQIMLADERKAEVLSLSRKDGEEEVEVKLSATDIVKEMLSAIPETALDRSNVDIPLNRQGEVDTTKDAKTRADELYEELYGEGAQAVTLTD